MIQKSSVLWLALAGLVMLSAVGCSTGPSPRAYDIRVTLDPALASGSTQIDLVGANAADLPKWQSYSMAEYWRADDVKRRDADKVVLRLGQGAPAVQALSASDPVWRRWEASGAQHLVVLAQLSGITRDRDGDADPRRMILTLDRREWGSAVNTIELLVQESGIRLMTPRKFRR